MAVLEISNLYKSFGGINALSGVNMRVEKGQIAGLIGPNGAGKTTLFNMLTGIYSPTSGQIICNLGKRRLLNRINPHKASEYGISRTFQNIRLFKNMTVLDNVRMGFHNSAGYGVAASLLRLPVYYREEKRMHDTAVGILEAFNLSDKKDEMAVNLSYGSQRRLEIARAVSSNPGILLLDEPAAGMNPMETKELTEMIRWVRDKFKLTIILIEHDMSLVMEICEKVFVLDYGVMIAEGTADEIRNNTRVIEAYLGGTENA
jgi:branched-chain amino acid transport system ATP-binding protein